MILTVFPAFTSLTSHLHSLVFLDRMNVSTMCALREDMRKVPADKRKVSRASVGGYKGDYQGDYQGGYHWGLHHLHHQVSVGDHRGLHRHKTLNRNGWTWMKLEPEWLGWNQGGTSKDRSGFNLFPSITVDIIASFILQLLWIGHKLFQVWSLSQFQKT